MQTRAFLQQLDDDAIAAAIAAAERTTSGEIRVWVSQQTPDDVVARAARRFEQLGMQKTRDRNAVLLYFAPRAQKFAVIGDQAIHEKCGQPFWDEVAAEIRAQLRDAKFTPAVVGAVAKVGAVLARHFPRRDDDTNELPNRVERD
jgi:uncharacterized membrane protein